MPRRTLGSILTAAITLTILAATAHALPEFLPSEGKNSNFTGASIGGTEFENTEGTKFKCSAAPMSGGFETDTLGTYHILFEKCTSSGFGCTGAGDASDSVLSGGSFHFVYDTLGTGEGLGVAILFLSELTEFTCAGFITSKFLPGKLLCLILRPLTSSITHEFHCTKGTNKGEAGEKKYWNDNGTIVEAQLLSKFNGAAEFKETNLLWLSTFTTPKPSAFMNE